MRKRKQVSEKERTGELVRENSLVKTRDQVSEEDDTGKGGSENRWLK